jgi:hypothetical protein
MNVPALVACKAIESTRISDRLTGILGGKRKREILVLSYQYHSSDYTPV